MKFRKAGLGVQSVIFGFVGLVVLFALLANLYPTLLSYGDTYNDSGAPLGSFWIDGGVGWIIFGAVMLLALIAMIMKFGKGGK
jgi:ABC-type phosphate transport system permease subunit